MSKLNLPNKLTVLRMILIPFFMFFIVFPIMPSTWSRIIAAAIFILTSITDFLDGMIARRCNLVTDFGKLLDPLADKLMVFGAMLGILVLNREDAMFTYIFVWVALIVITREIAVTSLRLIAASKKDVVVPANWLGKVKTVMQILCIVSILLEPVISATMYVSYVMMGLMTVMTVLSGLNYFKIYFPLLDSDK